MTFESKSIDTIPTPPKPILDAKAVWNYEDILKERPRASVKEIKEAYRITKILHSMAENKKKGNLKSYTNKR